MDVLVSIIVPVYNVEAYVEKCIKSLINQSYKNLEILLIDDGSSDKSGIICEQYQKKDSRIKVFHKINGGLSDARNYGLLYASGEYILFVDSDDWIELDSVKKLMEYAQKVNADIVCYGINDYVNKNIEAKRGVAECQVISGKEALYLLVEKGDDIGIVAWNKLYKRNLFENVQFEKGRINEDVFFTPKVINFAKKVGMINYYGYNYVMNRSGSICNKLLSEKNMDAIDAFLSDSIFFEEKDKYLSDVYKLKAVNMMFNLYCNAKKQNNAELCHTILEKKKINMWSTAKVALNINYKEFFKILIFCGSKKLYYRLWIRKENKR